MISPGLIDEEITTYLDKGNLNNTATAVYGHGRLRRPYPDEFVREFAFQLYLSV
jgi:hypothetical protein